MCKPNSYSFINTEGHLISELIKPSVQKELVTAAARERADELVLQSNNARRDFCVATIVIDEETGNVYFGYNGGIKKENLTINPILLDLLPQVTLNFNKNVSNCAESHAINQALNEGAKLENLHMTTINTVERFFGRDKLACENCTYAFKGKIKRNNTGWKGV